MVMKYVELTQVLVFFSHLVSQRSHQTHGWWQG